MDSGRFDALARQLSQGSSRRRLVGGIGGTALVGLLAGFAHNAEAKKHKKKKKKCKGCTECQACQKGKCKPKPAGAACSTGTCQEGEICSCTLAPDTCPTGCACTFLRSGGLTSCVQSDGISEGPLCESDAACVRGEKCVVAEYDPGTHLPIFRCVAVCDA